MKVTLLILGAVLVVTGVIWILQGIGALKGSFMTGQPLWAWMGGAAVLAGVPLVARGLRRAR